MNESDAKAALHRQGIRNPSRQLVADYMRIQHAEEWALEVPERSTLGQEPTEQEASSPNFTESRPHPSSESNLEPTLRERGELQRPAGRRKPGRPRVQAPWFQALANLMVDGSITLRQALRHLGVQGLSERELRALYRNRALTAMRREARQKWFRQGGIRPRDRRRYACKGGLRLGPSPELLRIL